MGFAVAGALCGAQHVAARLVVRKMRAIMEVADRRIRKSEVRKQT
jgi:hypothetical protein